MTRVPHLAFPLRLVRGQVVVVEEDSAAHLADRLAVAMQTVRGGQLDAPEFGVPPMLMQVQPLDLDELRAALATSVPEAAAVLDRVESLDDLRVERLRILIAEEA